MEREGLNTMAAIVNTLETVEVRGGRNLLALANSIAALRELIQREMETKQEKKEEGGEGNGDWAAGGGVPGRNPQA